MCGCTHPLACVRRAEDTLQESVLSFHSVGCANPNQVTGLSDKCLSQALSSLSMYVPSWPLLFFLFPPFPPSFSLVNSKKWYPGGHSEKELGAVPSVSLGSKATGIWPEPKKNVLAHFRSWYLYLLSCKKLIDFFKLVNAEFNSAVLLVKLSR